MKWYNIFLGEDYLARRTGNGVAGRALVTTTEINPIYLCTRPELPVGHKPTSLPSVGSPGSNRPPDDTEQEW